MTCYGVNLHKSFSKQYSDYWMSPLSLDTDVRYYATFKVEKLELLLEFRVTLKLELEIIGCSTKLIHVCKKLPLELGCRQSKYS